MCVVSRLIIRLSAGAAQCLGVPNRFQTKNVSVVIRGGTPGHRLRGGAALVCVIHTYDMVCDSL